MRVAAALPAEKPSQAEGFFMLNSALEYAAWGWPVFPVNPETRKPCVAGGFHAATLDRAEIRRWWRKWPGATIATPTGLTFVVLDIDRHEADGFEALRGHALPPTLVARTPRNGEHRFYIASVRGRRGLLPGVDLKGAGGYVELPPAAGRTWVGGEMVPLPGWIVELVEGGGCSTTQEQRPSAARMRERLAAIKLTARPGSHEANYALKSLSNAMNEIARATAHRNDLLYKKSYVMGRQLIRGWISARTIEFALTHGARSCGLVLWTGEAQVRATIMSGLWDGIKVPYRDLKCFRCCVVEHPPWA
jgi:putative DNA primase/helicase